MSLLFPNRNQFPTSRLEAISKSSVQPKPNGFPGTEESDAPPRMSQPANRALGHVSASELESAVASLTDEELSELIGLAIKLYDEGVLDPANRAEVIRNYNARKTASNIDRRGAR